MILPNAIDEQARAVVVQRCCLPLPLPKLLVATGFRFPCVLQQVLWGLARARCRAAGTVTVGSAGVRSTSTSATTSASGGASARCITCTSGLAGQVQLWHLCRALGRSNLRGRVRSYGARVCSVVLRRIRGIRATLRRSDCFTCRRGCIAIN